MFTATISEINKEALTPTVKVTFTDGTRTLVETFEVKTERDLNNQVENRRLYHEQHYALIDKLDQTFELKTDSAPTQAEIDRSNYYVLRGKLERAKLDVDLGIISSDDANLVKLLSDVKTAYKPEYTGF